MHLILVHLHEILGQTKPMVIEIKIVVVWNGRRLTEKEHRGTSLDVKHILYLDEGVGFIGVYINCHLANYTHKIHCVQITSEFLKVLKN